VKPIGKASAAELELWYRLKMNVLAKKRRKYRGTEMNSFLRSSRPFKRYASKSLQLCTSEFLKGHIDNKLRSVNVEKVLTFAKGIKILKMLEESRCVLNVYTQSCKKFSKATARRKSR
jgi:hypothetical protein